jgi:hypothetical protein
MKLQILNPLELCITTDTSLSFVLRDGRGLNTQDLHGVLGRPFPSRAIVPGLVRLQKLGNVGDQGILGVGIRQEGANRKQNLGDGQGRAPLVLQNVEADTAVRVDVTMVNTCGKVDLRRL